jgi:radical SAM superfamily enzyme YgiQ (UPF0313 family)
LIDIVLINPRFRPSYWGMNYALPIFRGEALLPLINLPLLAALTPPGHNITIVDENVEKIDFERCARADIVGLTGMNVQRVRMREILIELKARGAFVVVGGPWVTVYPQDFEGLCDVVFVGEAEETWPQFLEEWSEGRHQLRYEQVDKTDMTTLPPPRLDLLPMHKYVYGTVQISRGCPFMCEFCDIIVVFGRRPRMKTSAQIIIELENCLAAGKKYLFIVDDNLIGNKKAVKIILRDIIAWQRAHGYPLKFATEASIDLAEDEELLDLMVEANFDEIFVGIESPNEAALRETRKVQNLSDRRGSLLEKVHHIQDKGLDLWCGMIVGFDADDETIFDRQRRFIHESRIALAMINILVAIPKTPLFARLEREGRIDNSGELANFGTISTNVVPARLNRDTLCEGYLELMRDIYEPQAFFSRLDAIYLQGKPRPPLGSDLYLQRDFPRRVKKIAWNALETGYIIVQLMRTVPSRAQRRAYRRRLWNVIRRRPSLSLLHFYAVKFGQHYHIDRLIGQMTLDRAALAARPDDSFVLPPEVPAHATNECAEDRLSALTNE